MSKISNVFPPIRVSASGHVAADAGTIYDFVQDLSRARLWNPSLDGDWAAGPIGSVGAALRFTQERSDDVVEWAPMRRGVWSSDAVVVEARPGRSFRWAVPDGTHADQASVWGFDIEPALAGSLLTHSFEMRAITEEIGRTVGRMGTLERIRFFVEWRSQLRTELRESVARVGGLVTSADVRVAC